MEHRIFNVTSNIQLLGEKKVEGYPCQYLVASFVTFRNSRLDSLLSCIVMNFLLKLKLLTQLNIPVKLFFIYFDNILSIFTLYIFKIFFPGSSITKNHKKIGIK